MSNRLFFAIFTTFLLLVVIAMAACAPNQREYLKQQWNQGYYQKGY